jgi:hypothetical protein
LQVGVTDAASLPAALADAAGMVLMCVDLFSLFIIQQTVKSERKETPPASLAGAALLQCMFFHVCHTANSVLSFVHRRANMECNEM